MEGVEPLRIEGLSDPMPDCDEDSRRFRSELARKEREHTALLSSLACVRKQLKRAGKPDADYDAKLARLSETLHHAAEQHRLAELALAAFRKDRIPLETQRQEARERMEDADRRIGQLRERMSFPAGDVQPFSYHAAAYMEVLEWPEESEPLSEQARRVMQSLVDEVQDSDYERTELDRTERETDLAAIEALEPQLHTRANRALLEAAGRYTDEEFQQDLFNARALRREVESQLRLKQTMRELQQQLEQSPDYTVERTDAHRVSRHERETAAAYRRAERAHDRFLVERQQEIVRDETLLRAKEREAELLHDRIRVLEDELRALRREEPAQAAHVHGLPWARPAHPVPRARRRGQPHRALAAGERVCGTGGREPAAVDEGVGRGLSEGRREAESASWTKKKVS